MDDGILKRIIDVSFWVIIVCLVAGSLFSPLLIGGAVVASMVLFFAHLYRCMSLAYNDRKQQNNEVDDD